MIERIGKRALPEIETYLWERPCENIYLLSDLEATREQAPLRPEADTFALLGYRLNGRVIGAQAFYRYGRWFPQFESEAALDAMLHDMRQRHVRWILGVRRVVDPILRRLTQDGRRLSHDELDWLCAVDRASLHPYHIEGVRRAVEQDAEAMADLRLRFEVEYFHTAPERVDRGWCRSAAERYIADGAYLAEREGRVAAMVVVEARIEGLAQVGAVFTTPDYRGQGLAKGVVSALCEELLAQVEQVTLTVRLDNDPALSAYEALGFRKRDEYRMSRFVS